MLDNGHTPEEMLAQVLEGLDLEITDTLPARFYCNCSKERIEKAIISIGSKEIQSMIDDGKDIEVKCHFCNTAYNVFSETEIKRTAEEERDKSKEEGGRNETRICQSGGGDAGYPGGGCGV